TRELAVAKSRIIVYNVILLGDDGWWTSLTARNSTCRSPNAHFGKRRASNILQKETLFHLVPLTKSDSEWNGIASLV
ncbi:5946_t:CDS:2, partial [Acaulospora colombiana]